MTTRLSNLEYTLVHFRGNVANFSVAGIEKEFEIEAIEFALQRDDDKAWENIALGFSGLTDAEKVILKTQSPFIEPISIKEKNSS